MGGGFPSPAARGPGPYPPPSRPFDLHFNLAGVGQIADQVVRIDDLDVVRQLDIAGHHGAGAILAQHQGHFVAVVQLEHHALEVQQDVDDIFTNTGNGRIFVHHASHLHFGRRVAGHRRQQNAAQGVAQRVAVAALERLHHDLGVMRPDRFDFDGTRLQKTFEWTCTVFLFNTLGSLHR